MVEKTDAVDVSGTSEFDSPFVFDVRWVAVRVTVRVCHSYGISRPKLSRFSKRSNGKDFAPKNIPETYT